MAIFGFNGVIRQPGAKYQVKRNGLAVFTETYFTDGTFVASQGTYAPFYPNTILTEITVTHTGNGCSELQLDLKYEGKDSRFTTTQVSADVTLEYQTSLEPIDSHIDFVEFAGTPTDPQNGAVFDPDTGGFRFFAPVIDGELNPFAGISSYYMPIATLRSNVIESNWPSSTELNNIGKISSPSGSAPNLGGNRNWLLSGIVVRNIGNIYYETQRIYAGSGPRGWNEDIYG